MEILTVFFFFNRKSAIKIKITTLGFEGGGGGGGGADFQTSFEKLVDFF